MTQLVTMQLTQEEQRIIEVKRQEETDRIKAGKLKTEIDLKWQNFKVDDLKTQKDATAARIELKNDRYKNNFDYSTYHTTLQSINNKIDEINEALLQKKIQNRIKHPEKYFSINAIEHGWNLPDREFMSIQPIQGNRFLQDGDVTRKARPWDRARFISKDTFFFTWRKAEPDWYHVCFENPKVTIFNKINTDLMICDGCLGEIPPSTKLLIATRKLKNI